MTKPFFLIKIVNVGNEKILEKEQVDKYKQGELTHLVTGDFRDFIRRQYNKRGKKL